MNSDTGTIAQQAIDYALAEGWRTLPDDDTESKLRESVRVLGVMYAAAVQRTSAGYVRRELVHQYQASTA